MRLCDYCSAGMAILPTLEIGQYIFCNADCAAKRIAELEAALTAANQSRPASVTEQDLANNMPDEFGD